MTPTKDRDAMIRELAASYLEEMSLKDLERYFYEDQISCMESYDTADLEQEYTKVFGEL